MKKILLLTGIISCVSFAATAQSTTFGIKAGVNVADIKVSNGTDFNSKAGFHAGGLAHIHVSDHFAVQPEVVYSMQGGKNGNTIRRHNYINIPVLAQYMFNNGFRLQTGPQLGLLVAAKNKVGDVEVDVKDDMRTAELAWTVGASYVIPQNGFGFDVRYNFGITNTLQVSSPEARNMVFQAGVFYLFHGRHR